MARERFYSSFWLIPPLALTGLLASCFGGIGDGEAQGFEKGADASGIWLGTIDVDGEAQNIGAVLINAPDGTMYMDTTVGMLVGEAATRGNAFTADADGYSYQVDFPEGSEFSLNAVVNEQASILGSFAGSARSGIYQFEYNSRLSTQAAAVQLIAGTYYGSIGRIRDNTASITVTIGQFGELNIDTGGSCTLTGTVEVLDSPRNLYKWSGTMSGCPINGNAGGIGFGQDGPEGRGFHFVGTVNDGAGGGGISFAGFNGPGPSAIGFGALQQVP
jgi:hypothetical protein